jgi:uncharacterized membrane protein YkvA (DUF1232 family)
VVTAHSGCPEHGDRAALATAALTYAFDPEDYIDDAAELGLLDDLYVLRAAVAFVG